MTSAEIQKRLKKTPDWKYSVRTRSIRTEIRCRDFMAAVGLIGRIARLAEKMDHHPDLHLTHYRRLKIVLTTHSAGGVTAKDLKMAKIIRR
jgi:4a-hydroxytetrahydrobiopterin dehydratase